MKKKKISKIPKFKSLEEEARFWDTHSVTDFEDETKDIDIVVDLAKPRDETLVVRIQKSLKKKLSSIANKKGITTSTLARIWLAERLSRATR
ncbi:MAG: CopG family antitoxin [Patescibacteria group bacterium]